MNNGTAAGIYIIIPAKEISLHTPSIKINIIFRLEQGKLFFDLSSFDPTCFNFKDRKKIKQLLTDHSNLNMCRIIDMDLMSKCKHLCPDKIPYIALLIIDIISI